MTIFGLKQFGLVLFLMVSLLTAGPAACACSHSEEATTSEIECNSHHEELENVESSEAVVAEDDCCICSVDQRSPYAVAKSVGKEYKPSGHIANSVTITADQQFVTVLAQYSFKPEFTRDHFYSNTLKSLLPSRAPPRL